MPTKKTITTNETTPVTETTPGAPEIVPALVNSKPVSKKPATKIGGEETVKAAPAKKAAAPKSGEAATKKTAPAKESSQLTKVYGEIQTSGNTFFIHKGSVAEGQLQLIVEKEELKSRIPSYDGQFVTILGEVSKKKKTDKASTFLIHNIASHDQIGRRAFELSQDNPEAVEDNWFKAENELLF